MKTLKTFSIVCVLACTYSCSNSDDDSTSNSPQQTTKELLTSGKWYYESKTPGSYTPCEKKGNIHFMTDGNMTLNSFDDSSGTCQSLGEVAATYTLTNDVNITITAGPDIIIGTIDDISEDEMTFISNGETLVFDKTEG